MTNLSLENLKKELATGKSIRQIAIDNDMNYQSLWKRCTRYNLKSIESIIDEERIAKLYGEGMSVQEIGEKIGISSVAVWRILKCKNITMRKPGNKISMNESFFESINSEQKAYWLGAICADGSVSSGEQKSINFTVKAADVEWVAGLKHALGSNVRITYAKNDWSGAAQFIVTSEKMHADLVSLGVVPRKSKVLECPIIERDLRIHFWRGVLDGDGSIVDAKSMAVTAVTTASASFAESSKEFIESLGLKCNVIYDGSVINVRLYGDDARNYVRQLYLGSKYNLRRKFVRAMNLIGVPVTMANGLNSISNDIAAVFIGKYHYLGSLKPSTTFGWYVDDDLVGVLAIGSCSSPSVASTIFGNELASGVRELHRFCLKRNEPNLASKFLAAALRKYSELNPNITAIVAFADTAQGHEGIMYRAVGAVQLSTSLNEQLVIVSPDGKRWTGRQDVILSGLRARGIDLADCRLESSTGKNKFVMLIGANKKQFQGLLKSTT